jgi:hypothetical protein
LASTRPHAIKLSQVLIAQELCSLSENYGEKRQFGNWCSPVETCKGSPYFGLIEELRCVLVRAIYRHEERVFNPDRKDHHWSKRKLKRDQ